MRITFERTGGFSGRKLQASIDTNALTPAQAHELLRLVEQSGFFALPGKLDSARPQPDRFQYLLTVEKGGDSHTVRASEAAVPPAMRPLLQWLSRFRGSR